MSTENFTWKGISLDTTEHCRIENTAGEQIITSEIVGTIDGEHVFLSYQLNLDKHWNIQSFIVENKSSKKPFYFAARRYETVRWKDQQGGLLASFDNCIDIDIFPTPFTNSLPLKRQRLEIGEEREYLMMWIDLTDGEIRTDRQNYRRLDKNVYRFTSLDTNFIANIEFTADTIVKFYPDLFELSERY